LRSVLAPWAPPNNKKSESVALKQQSTCGNTRGRSCQFDEHFKRLTLGGMHVSHDSLIRRNCHKKNSCRTHDGKTPVGMPKSGASRTNQAYRTGACRTRPIVPFAGYSGETVIVPKLDQRWSRVYSLIIRTGLSPPSQSSPLNLVVTGKGFLCLRCKEGGNLVDRLCVTCGYSWWNSERSHHIVWSAPDLFLRRTVVLKGGGLL
jgi:hypothetical protein